MCPRKILAQHRVPTSEISEISQTPEKCHLTKISELAINSLQCYICSSLALRAQIERRSNLSCSLDLDLGPQLRSRSNGRGLDLDLQLSLRSRSNGHGLDLDLWPSHRSRSNSCGLDLDLPPRLRSRSNSCGLDLDLRLSLRSRSMTQLQV